MVSVLIASVPIHGHVTPLLAVARHLVARGDDVRFLTGSRFADAVATTGARHIALTGLADYDDRVDINARFPQRARLTGARAVAFDVEHLFINPGVLQCHNVVAAHAAQPIDVVLADSAFAGGAFLLGYPRATRPPVVMCSGLPLGLSSRDTAPFGLGIPPARWGNRPRNAVLTWLTRPVLASATRRADRLYRELHNCSMPFSVHDWAAHADAIVQFTVPAFEYPRSDAPPHLRFAGPLSARGSHAPKPDWWADLDGSTPVVHVTQGTFANKYYSQLIVPTLEAMSCEDVLVVVTTGGRPVDTLPPLPANARAADYLSYDELLPLTSAFVTNGGYGGVQYALRYGVPIVATGGKEDKPEVGARVRWSGVGRQIRRERPNVRQLHSAITTVLNDERYRRASRRVAADMASSGGYSVLTDVIDGLVATPRSACS